MLRRLSTQMALVVLLMLLLKSTIGEEFEIVLDCNKYYHMVALLFLMCALLSMFNVVLWH